jgi:hypothetical protein
MWAFHQNLVSFFLFILKVDQQVDRNVSVLKHLKQSTFSSISNRHILGAYHLDSGVSVEQNALLNPFDGLISELAVEQSVFPSVLDISRFTVEMADFHLVLGKSSGLAAA